MLKPCRVTKVKVFFLAVLYIFNLDLVEFSATILKKGLHVFLHNPPNHLEICYNFLVQVFDLRVITYLEKSILWLQMRLVVVCPHKNTQFTTTKNCGSCCLKFLCGAVTDALLHVDLLRALCKEQRNVENPNWD